MSAEANLHELEVECPICKKLAKVKVPDEIFTESSNRIVSIHVDEGICCEHRFLVLLSQNKKIIGYQRVDISVDILNSQENPDNVTILDVMQNYGLETLQKIIHATIVGIPIALIQGENESRNRAIGLNKLFVRILPEKYIPPGSMIFSRIKGDNKKQIKAFPGLVIDENLKVAKIPFIEPPYDFESFLITSALDILDPEDQLVIIQELVGRLFEVTEAAGRKSRNWGAVSGTEIRKLLKDKKFDISSDAVLESVIQLIKYRHMGDLAKVMIDRNDRRVDKFYREVFKKKMPK